MPPINIKNWNPSLLCLVVAFVFANPCLAEQTSPAPTLELDLEDRPLLFDDESTSAISKPTSGFWDKFTFKLSQQIYAQTNSHRTASGVNKQATVEDNRLGLLVKYQNPFAPGWNLQGSGQSKIYWPSDYDFNGLSSQSIELEQRVENVEMRLNELYVSKSIGDHTLKLGRQTLVWGEAEGNSVLDTLNALEYRDLSTIEVEDARLNQWFAVWEYFKANQRLSTFVNLNPQFNPLPRKGSPAYTPSYFSIADPDNKQRFEAGARLQWSVEHSDIALMSAYLYENQLHYETPTSLSGQIQPKDNAYWLLGASANRAIGKLLLKLDLAYSHGLLEDTLISTAFYPRSSSVRKNQIAASLGFDYALTNEQSINASVLARAFLDPETGLAPGEKTVNGDIFGTWLIRYNCSFLNNTLLFTSYNQGTLNASQALSSAMLTYTLDDHWSIMGNVVGTFATRQSPLSILDKDMRLGFTISYSL